MRNVVDRGLQKTEVHDSGRPPTTEWIAEMLVGLIPSNCLFPRP